MPKNKDVEAWLTIAHALFNDLKPKDAGVEVLGQGIKKSEFAFLAHRETKRVNEALIKMSLAKDEHEVHQIFNALSKDTVTALLSRWAHYFAAWRKMENEAHPHLWVPPSDVWRGIFLAMTDDVPEATEACKKIWPEHY
jgi:hypothetical protein